jgi:hypothetical protein
MITDGSTFAATNTDLLTDRAGGFLPGVPLGCFGMRLGSHLGAPLLHRSEGQDRVKHPGLESLTRQANDGAQRGVPARPLTACDCAATIPAARLSAVTIGVRKRTNGARISRAR